MWIEEQNVDGPAVEGLEPCPAAFSLVEGDA